MQEALERPELNTQAQPQFAATTAEALGAMAEQTSREILEQNSGVPAASTTFEHLARSKAAIKDQATRLAVWKETTSYSMPEGERD